MDKRKYMRPTSEAVTVKSSLSLLAGSLPGLSGTKYDENGKPVLIGRKRNDIAREVDPWSWECVLWDQEANDVEDE
ncbi:MAG: hypothetical protein EGR49_06665 [Prevotella sp.]|nr:hypothetical protein [Prevotella sp.]